MKIIEPPFLTTSFSESGRKTKRRIANILSSKTKRAGVIFIVTLILLAGVAGASVSVENDIFYGLFGETKEQTLYDLSSYIMINDGPARLSNMRHKNLDSTEADEQRNMGIDLMLDMNFHLGAFTAENRTEIRPYGRSYSFETPFELMGEERSNAIMENYAVIIMSLVEDLDYVEWSYSGLSGGEKTMRLSFDDACNMTGVNIKLADTEADIYSLIRLTGLYQSQGMLGYYTTSEINCFEDSAFVITPDGVKNEQTLDIFLRAVEHGVPSSLKFSNRGVNIGIVRTDGSKFLCDVWENEKLHSLYGYTGLQIIRMGKRADFYLTRDENEPYMLFSIEEGEAYEQKKY